MESVTLTSRTGSFSTRVFGSRAKDMVTESLGLTRDKWFTTDSGTRIAQ
jgi:hypothetical protein